MLFKLHLAHGCLANILEDRNEGNFLGLQCVGCTFSAEDVTLIPSWASLVSQGGGGESAYNAGDSGLIPVLGRSPGEGNGYPLQYSYLENSMYIEDWRRRRWHPTPVLLPGKSHGQRSLVGCRLWGHTGSDTTEVT